MDIITRIFNPQDIWLCPIKKVDTKAPITKALLSNSAETEIIIIKNKATLRSLDIRVIGFLKIVNYCTSSKGKWTYNKSNPSGRTSNKNNVIKKIKSMKFKEGDIFYSFQEKAF
ncbi:hypothetical protein GCM10022216_30660 [Sphingobacterium kyonggiense]|uniref:FHA domain-containing protein n=1 Tax=Sphingobacterium kyonggiense TaxID=714075 RepID=A0ABP7Z2L4_9SPHI